MEQSNSPITCSGVEFSGTMVREVIGKKVALVIPREQIRQIKLIYDTAAKYPFFQFLTGFILLGLGVLGIIVSFLTSLRGSLPVDVESGSVRLQLIPISLWLMVGVGLWSLIGVFKASYYLAVETENGVKKLSFEKSTDLRDIRLFIRKVNWSFGYDIDTSILEKVQTS
jgi:hypothetical protein